MFHFKELVVQEAKSAKNAKKNTSSPWVKDNFPNFCTKSSNEKKKNKRLDLSIFHMSNFKEFVV